MGNWHMIKNQPSSSLVLGHHKGHPQALECTKYVESERGRPAGLAKVFN